MQEKREKLNQDLSCLFYNLEKYKQNEEKLQHNLKEALNKHEDFINTYEHKLFVIISNYPITFITVYIFFSLLFGLLVGTMVNW